MKKRFLEAGKIVNTHGIRGEVKIMPWCNSPSFLTGFKTLYIDETAISVKHARVNNGCVIASLSGIDSIDDAIRLKNKIVFIDRNDADIPEDEYFLQDIIGLDAIDADSGDKLGTIADVLELPGNNIYVIRGEREILVPIVPEFVKETSPDAGFVKIHLIDGM